MSDLAFTTMLIGMFVLVVTGLRTAESRFRRSASGSSGTMSPTRSPHRQRPGPETKTGLHPFRLFPVTTNVVCRASETAWSADRSSQRLSRATSTAVSVP
jgi:hypothetical protein